MSLQFNTSVASIFLHCIDHIRKKAAAARDSLICSSYQLYIFKGSLNSFSSSTRWKRFGDIIHDTRLDKTSFPSALDQVLLSWTKRGIMATFLASENKKKTS